MDYSRPWVGVIRWTAFTTQAEMSETDITFARSRGRAVDINALFPGRRWFLINTCYV